MTPALNSIIRINESEADAFGLDAAREPDGFALTAMKLSEYRKIEPGALEEMIFFDHPSGANAGADGDGVEGEASGGGRQAVAPAELGRRLSRAKRDDQAGKREQRRRRRPGSTSDSLRRWSRRPSR